MCVPFRESAVNGYEHMLEGFFIASGEMYKQNIEDLNYLADEDFKQLEIINIEIAELKQSIQPIQLQIDSLITYLKHGKGKFNIEMYVDLNESRGLEITNKIQAKNV